MGLVKGLDLDSAMLTGLATAMGWVMATDSATAMDSMTVKDSATHRSCHSCSCHSYPGSNCDAVFHRLGQQPGRPVLQANF